MENQSIVSFCFNLFNKKKQIIKKKRVFNILIKPV
jgi:hypothetical protein